MQHGRGQHSGLPSRREVFPSARRERALLKKLLGYFVPERLADSLADVDLEELAREGVRGVLVDLDNTLLPWNSSEIPPAHRAWLEAARARGISVCVISNNHTTRVESALRELGIPYVSSARKPLRVGFVRALRQLGLPPEACIVVGDQLLTDVWGAHRMGMRAVLVRPVVSTDGPHTRVNRFFERRLRRLLERLGLWPEEG
nr:YqeG family HAD IIIA-type phosphatase [Brockia lithotrophica]